ncbi:MAG TPA: sugar ABC transporter substrate-binding protein, partial [Roseiflexaceae bacterium]|nr:sugar ABC transporter substrate-binding protein [Roseiflexaceae bacterium]
TAPAADATAAPAADATAAPAPAAGGAVQLPQDPAAYGLKADKPYNGTKLNFLICCNSVGQFASLIKRTSEVFTPMTGIEVTWDNTPYASFQEKLLTEASTGSGTYDIVAWVDSWGQGLKPYLVPLDEKLKAENIDASDYPKAYLDAARGEDGQLYGLPFRGHAQVLFYRKDVFDQLGLQPPKTWDEVAASAKTIREKTQLNPIAMYYKVGAGQNLFIWLNLLWGGGGDIFDANKRPIFNNDAGLKATQQYVDYVKNNLTNESALTFGEGEATEEMTKGRAAMFVGWSWIYENFANKEIAAPEVLNNVGVVPAPSNGGEPVSYGYIWPTGILQSSKNQDAAWEYLKWLTNPQVEKAVVLDKSDPATSNIVVVRLSNLNDPQVNATSNGLHKVMGTMLQTARTQPLLAEWPEIQTVLETALNEAASGADVKATLDKAQQDVDEIMKRAGYYQ